VGAGGEVRTTAEFVRYLQAKGIAREPGEHAGGESGRDTAEAVAIRVSFLAFEGRNKVVYSTTA
jgi:hypothetical protein